jgi:2-keto-4-pentenoate hydratase/2-oxohepta-3-ene-1,7-dioic acid hydratase in catechol pathway
MRLCAFRDGDTLRTGVLIAGKVCTVEEINRELGTTFSTSMSALIRNEEIFTLQRILHRDVRIGTGGRALEDLRFAPPYPDPPKIWGIGLNYMEHAADLNVKPPEEPASFMRPSTTIIGHRDPIVLPRQSQRVTAEAELAVIIGRRCQNISVEEVPAVLLGFTTVLDMTAEDILRRNPRFLTRAKSFDTFFSFGPWILTPSEVKDLPATRIATVLNGRPERANAVGNMAFPPYELVAFHSHVMTLLPGDIISTGTPGAVVIRPGDVVRCEVEGFPALENPVA